MRWPEPAAIPENVKIGTKLFAVVVFVVIVLSVLYLSLPPSPDANVKVTEPIQTSANTLVPMGAFINSQHRHGTTIVATDISRYINPAKSLNIENENKMAPAGKLNTVNDILNRSINLSGQKQAGGIQSKNGEIILTPGGG